MWLAWSAWGVIGAIFVFEDIKGGSGWLTLLMTSPLWVAFAVWPFLWLWLRSKRDPSYVEIDDDIVAGDVKCRMVQKDGIRYMQKDDLKLFNIEENLKAVTLEGGDELFVNVESVRRYAKDEPRLKAWLDVVDSLDYPKTFY